jgi:MFS family permease
MSKNKNSISQNPSKKIRRSIIFIALAGQIAWAVENQYFNVFMYNKIAPIPIFISLMVAASAIVATITSILMGSYSDVKGKRRSLMLIGFIFLDYYYFNLSFISTFSYSRICYSDCYHF